VQSDRATNVSKSSLAFLPSDSFEAVAGREQGRPRPFAEDRGLSAEWGEGLGAGGTPTRR
jgi:hypothetical protein